MARWKGQKALLHDFGLRHKNEDVKILLGVGKPVSSSVFDICCLEFSSDS